MFKKGIGQWSCCLVSAASFLLVEGCAKEDVAPKMEHPPAQEESAWDAAVGEDEIPLPPPGDDNDVATRPLTASANPETAGTKAGKEGEEGKSDEGKGEERTDGQGEDDKGTPASDAEGALPPPPSGDDIPLGSPPLEEGVVGVTLKGVVEFPDYKQGIIQIDVSDRTSEGKRSEPSIVQLYRMEKPGPFELEVPENQGEVWLSAYCDADKNGRPSRGDPRGVAMDNPYTVKDKPIEGIKITLEKERMRPPPPKKK